MSKPNTPKNRDQTAPELVRSGDDHGPNNDYARHFADDADYRDTFEQGEYSAEDWQ